MDLNSLNVVALFDRSHPRHCRGYRKKSYSLIIYIYHQLFQRKILPWGSFPTARRERLATDIAIMSMLCEASAVISVNGFLHLHVYVYFYTVD